MMSARPGYEHQVRIPSNTHEAQRLQEFLLASLAKLDYDERVVFGIRLALEEALINAIKHGNQMDSTKFITISYTANREHFMVEIMDEGPGFRLEDVPDPTDPENLERPCGRGLLLMRTYMTECDFVNPGNICRMSRIRQ